MLTICCIKISIKVQTFLNMIPSQKSIKTVAKKDLFRHLGAITKEVMKEGTTFVVYQHSRPAFEIHPITSEISQKKSYTMKDLEIFTFSSNCPRESLSENYKQILYGDQK